MSDSRYLLIRCDRLHFWKWCYRYNEVNECLYQLFAMGATLDEIKFRF